MEYLVAVDSYQERCFKLLLARPWDKLKEYPKPFLPFQDLAVLVQLEDLELNNLWTSIQPGWTSQRSLTWWTTSLWYQGRSSRCLWRMYLAK